MNIGSLGYPKGQSTIQPLYLAELVATPAVFWEEYFISPITFIMSFVILAIIFLLLWYFISPSPILSSTLLALTEACSYY